MARAFRDYWHEPFQNRDGWLTVAVNALPILGVFFVGWDASTLVLLYWLETAIIGFWMVVQVVIGREGQFGDIRFGNSGEMRSGIGLGLFLIAHAGIFMGVHMFILTGAMPGGWLKHLGSPLDFVTGFVIPSGIWIPLLGLFVVRGVIAFDEMRRGAPLVHMIVGFYIRIIVMQTAILLGAMVTLLFGSAAFMLAVLVVLKTALDLYMPYVVGYAVTEMDKANKKAS